MSKLKNFDWPDLDHSIQENGFYIAHSPLSTQALHDLFKYYELLKHNNLLRQARIGKGLQEQKATSIRSDYIFWIDDWEVSKGLSQYKSFLEQLMDFMIQNFRLPLKRFEAHFASYPPGTFYKKHYDQHSKSMHRQVSIILYLTDHKEGDGGELMLYPKGNSPLKVKPEVGKIVIYPSRGMLHEVLQSHNQRVSLTAWMRDDLLVF